MAGDTRDLPEADRERVAQQAFDIAMRLETLTEKSGDQSGRWKAEVVG